MTDRPIPFTAAMIRALLDGRKKQTRRVLRPQPPSWCYADRRPGYSCMTPPGHIEFRGIYVDDAGVDHGPAAKFIKLPYLKGDRLWVREAWRVHQAYDDLKPSELSGEERVWPELDRDNYDGHGRYRHGRFMPRWASRLTLLVHDVKVERLQDISEADAIAEGIERGGFGGLWGWIDYGDQSSNMQRYYSDPRESFRSLWNSLHGPDAWDANPWLVVPTFRVERGNIDRIAA